MSKGTIVNVVDEVQRSKKIVDLLRIETPSIYTKVNSLSGGNKQKVSFGKWITTKKNKPIVYIFDEPTEGVDVEQEQKCIKSW